MIKGGILMRILERLNDKYNLSSWSRNGRRVQKVHEDQFKNELEGSINKRKPEEKKRPKNKPAKEVDLRNKTHHEVQSIENRFSS